MKSFEDVAEELHRMEKEVTDKLVEISRGKKSKFYHNIYMNVFNVFKSLLKKHIGKS
jgi:hypothetical protein